MMKANGRGMMLERRGWRLTVAEAPMLPPELREAVIERALDAAEGRIEPAVRRSRRATTFRAELRGIEGAVVFIKLTDPPAAGWFARTIKRPRGSRAAAISNSLRAHGLNAPAVVLYGRESRSGRELTVTPRADGVMITRQLSNPEIDFARKRVLLRAIGAAVARMHRAGFIHGDLTPFNIIANESAPPDITFIDHERTRVARFGSAARQRRRNMVQLARFQLAGVTATDRMRVWQAYAGELPRVRRKAELERILRMLKKRIARDGAIVTVRASRVAEQKIARLK